MRGIIYNNELFQEFTAEEFREWENATDDATGSNAEERELAESWITYDFLVDRGYFVPAPTKPRPAPVARKVIPFDTPLTSYIREPTMTQSEVLKERERLLDQREKLIQDKLAFERRQMQASQKRIPKHVGGYDFKMYNKDGSEISFKDILKFGVVLFIICAVLSAAFC